MIRTHSFPTRWLGWVLPLAVGWAVGCSGKPPEPPHQDDQANSPHEQAIAELQALGGRLDVGQDGLGKSGVKLDYRNTKLNDEGLTRLKALNPILELYLNNTAVTDQGMANLADLSQLQRLCLNGTAVTDAGLQHLTGLSHLEVLTLQDTKVTPKGVQSLQKALPKAKIFR